MSGWFRMFDKDGFAHFPADWTVFCLIGYVLGCATMWVVLVKP